MRCHFGDVVSIAHKLTIPISVETKLALKPILFHGHVKNRHHKVSYEDADYEMLLENVPSRIMDRDFWNYHTIIARVQ